MNALVIKKLTFPRNIFENYYRIGNLVVFMSVLYTMYCKFVSLYKIENKNKKFQVEINSVEQLMLKYLHLYKINLKIILVMVLRGHPQFRFV